MAGNLNWVWEQSMKSYKAMWRMASNTKGAAGVRNIFREAGMGGKGADYRNLRSLVGYGGRYISGAIVGAAAGATWGAVSDKESILGGALKGAFVGGAAAVSMRGLKKYLGPNRVFGNSLKPLRNLSRTRFTNISGMRENIGNAWGMMSQKRNRTMRNWIVGMGALGVARGVASKEDNPVGGAVSGAIGGAIQGAAIYGGYRMGRNMWNSARAGAKRISL